MAAEQGRASGSRALVAVAWLFALAFAFRYLGFDLIRALGSGTWNVEAGTLIGRDFVNVYTAGHMVWDGGLSRIYDLAAYADYQRQLFDGAVANHYYSYTPVSFFYVWLFAPLPYVVAYLLWIALTGAAFLLAARPYLRDAGLPAWLALVVPAAAVNVWAGHYGFLFGALWLAAWRLLDSRPRTAGLLIGLMIVKPHLALLMPLLLARRGDWTAFLYAGITVFGLVAASGLLFGPDYWITYVRDTLLMQAALVDDTNQFFLRMMPTVLPTMLHAGAGLQVAWAVQAVFAVGAIAALWRFMPRDPGRAGLAAACATFLILPYAFIYDMTVVSIAALVLMHRIDSCEPAGWRLLGALAFLAPLMAVPLNGIGIPLVPLLVALLLAWILRGGGVAALPARRKEGEPVPAGA